MDNELELLQEDNGDKRDRGYLRKVKAKKIKKRKQLIKDLRRNWPYFIYQIYHSKYVDVYTDIIFGNKDGKLSKGHIGFLGNGGTAIKTNTRKGHASYRHKGAYGKTDNYNKHDKQQIEKFEFDMNEFKNEQ